MLSEDETFLDYLESDVGLALRQYVQWLDKALYKPRSLRRMDLASYRARTFLGECLWDLFESRYLDGANTDCPRVNLRDVWHAKVHPYARHEVNWKTPDQDNNAKEIKEYIEKRPEYRRQMHVSKTKWSDVFGVPLGAPNIEDYRKSADAIEAHLRIQEIKIDGKERKRRKTPVANGFIRERGDAILQSVSDPRVRSQRRVFAWGEREKRIYLGPGDVAAQVREELIDGRRSERPRRVVGRLLYDHFGHVGGADKEKYKPSQELWNLHNAVRRYYRRVLETRRFLEAVRGDDRRKLGFLLPTNLNELFKRLDGAQNSQELQRQIRLGKLIAHSIDLCMSENASSDENFDAVVRDAMDYFATSVGQADIKRNEAFVRVLRTSVTFAQRTLDAWLEPGHASALALAQEGGEKEELAILEQRDVALTKVGARAITHLDENQASDHGRIIFGSRTFPIRIAGLSNGELTTVSRTQILFDGSPTDKEVLWGLSRLAARIRDHSYHFNTKGRLLQRIAGGGALEAFGRNATVVPFVDRDGLAQKLTVEALDRIRRLLAYDLQIEASVLALELNRIGFAQHVPADRRAQTLALIGRAPASNDRVTPKFMTVLKKAQGLATGDTRDATDPLLRPFAALELHDLSKGKARDIGDEATLARAVNHDRIGLLRFLYDRAFPAWLEEKEADTIFAREIFSLMLKAKQKRRDAYEKEKDRPSPKEESFAERLLTQATTLDDMELQLQSEALLETKADVDDDRLMEHLEALADEEASGERQMDVRGKTDPYVPDRQMQQEQASRLQEFRRELYGYLFASFLTECLPDGSTARKSTEEPGGSETPVTSWIWSLGHYVDTDDASSIPVTAEEITGATKASDKEDYPEWLHIFYAWLYLVPPDAIAQLQHQFRKTAILERKAARDRKDVLWSQNPTEQQQKILLLLGPDPRGSTTLAQDAPGKPALTTKPETEMALRQIDRVMGLYTRVQAAGFAGSEIDVQDLFQNAGDHAVALPPQVEPGEDDVTGEEAELAPLMLAGTLAGLRQMKRFNTSRLLKGTFSKHRVQPHEVDLFEKMRRETALTPFAEKQRLHKALSDGASADTPKHDQLYKMAGEYKARAAEVCEYNFAISAARLADFANVQHLLMAILARLTDFSALWERDRDCALLAACFEQIPDLRLVRENSEVRWVRDTDNFSAKIFDRSSGFRFASAAIQAAGPKELSHETRQELRRFFGLFRAKGELRQEHARDVTYRNERNPELQRRGEPPLKPNVGHFFGLDQIRKDLAHFNILDRKPDLGGKRRATGRQDINLTYVINAVRALLSHDRKLKNAVPKAIADILQRQGMALTWSFSRDRLRAAELRPVLLPHLAFLTLKLDQGDGTRKRQSMAFPLPRVSPRRLSMTRALFDFGSSGYLGGASAEGERRRLTYPEPVVAELLARGVPPDVVKIDQSASESGR